MTYPPSKFARDDQAEAVRIAVATRFATLVAAASDNLLTVHLPLTLVEQSAGEARFAGHLLRSNPLFAAMQAGRVRLRAIFLPAQGYVSPSIYAEKALSGKVVPTWNYVAAHLDGEAWLSEDSGLLEILESQASDYEAATGGTWQVADAPASFIEGLARAIAGFNFVAREFRAIRKLSQNRPPADRAAVAGWLADSRPQTAEIAWWMQRSEEEGP